MKTTFLNRKEAQQRAGLVVKQETVTHQKIKLQNSAFGGVTTLNEKKIEKRGKKKDFLTTQYVWKFDYLNLLKVQFLSLENM